MFNMKTLAAAAAISVGFAFAVPATSQAMPVGPVKIQTEQNKDISTVHYKKKKWRKHRWRESRRWRHGRRWARYCDPWDGCYRRRHARFYRYWDEPYYGYGGYPYGGYYGGPGFYGPGIGLHFRID
jgi:hypothetical protein